MLIITWSGRAIILQIINSCIEIIGFYGNIVIILLLITFIVFIRYQICCFISIQLFLHAALIRLTQSILSKLLCSFVIPSSPLLFFSFCFSIHFLSNVFLSIFFFFLTRSRLFKSNFYLFSRYSENLHSSDIWRLDSILFCKNFFKKRLLYYYSFRELFTPTLSVINAASGGNRTL